MDEMMVKTESNGEILLFYVDENGGNEQGVVTTIQNIEAGQLEVPQHESYIIEEVDDNISMDETNLIKQESEAGNERWADGEIKRLLIFYIDNKETFVSGQTKKKHLWTVACKTMLTSKAPSSCEMKIRNLKRKYSLIRQDESKYLSNEKNTWPYYDLCHQAFHDQIINIIDEKQQIIKMPVKNTDGDGIVVVKKVNPRQVPDAKVEQMLQLYLKHKRQTPKEYWVKQIFEKIASSLGEDSDYWHKRFLNYKNRYISLLQKRKESGDQTITWPYMKLFDEIYLGDTDFKWNQMPKTSDSVKYTTENDLLVPLALEWDETEKTVLAKYCFDCFDEFQDETIPNSFLWHEIERLLDKPRDTCKAKYEELRSNHINMYISGYYALQIRKPIDIILDNLISKEIELELSKASARLNQLITWEAGVTDEMVQFFLHNIELFKDETAHFVCWAAVSKKLSQSVSNCRDQWRDLTSVYKSILNDKKEDPDMQVDWRYTDMLDRIFDYGMDTTLLEGYEKKTEVKESIGTRKIAVKKIELKGDNLSNNELYDEDYDEQGIGKRPRGSPDPKQFKILEYYQKNKTKFSKSQQKKATIWEGLAKQLGLTSEQCAHRFRNLKQVYTTYVQREIKKPEKPILWPYYALCKKVFGYRAIQNKLKNAKYDSDEDREWSTKEIKQLIDHFAKNVDAINNDIDNAKLWDSVAHDIGNSASSCRDKFLELRKSYRQLKGMKSRNKNYKVVWKYYKKFEEIYAGGENERSRVEAMDVDADDDANSEVTQDGTELLPAVGTIKTELQDEDYQCIIVIPEGEELTGIENAKIIIKEPTESTETPKAKPEKPKWTKKAKTMLLERYLAYVQAHIDETIKTAELWKDVAKKISGKSPLQCKEKYISMRRLYNKEKNETPYTALFKKIFELKPKIWKSPSYEELVSQDIETFRNVDLVDWKVEKGLKYYLEHIEEFLNPKYEKKYAWLELANHISVPIAKVYMKINYLKQFFNSETNEVAGVKVEFGDLIKEILEKEFVVEIAMESQPQPVAIEDSTEMFHTWSDEETEVLLNWYLENLGKFKNPKYVPSYLWMEASMLLNKSAVECSKKMSEIRTQYSSIMKENPESLLTWRYSGLCQKIYGTGKKGTPINSD